MFERTVLFGGELEAPRRGIRQRPFAMAVGDSVLNPKSAREGIVLRPLVTEEDPELGRLSFKAINPKFLLKYDE